MSAPVTPNAELIGQGVAQKITAALPETWSVYHRRDGKPLAGDKYPRVYVVVGRPQILEEETDNRDLVGYRTTVLLAVREAGVKRTDPNLAAARRLAIQAVNTTQYPGLEIEQLVVDDAETEGTVDAVEEGETRDGFTITLGVLEPRCLQEQYP